VVEDRPVLPAEYRLANELVTCSFGQNCSTLQLNLSAIAELLVQLGYISVKVTHVYILIYTYYFSVSDIAVILLAVIVILLSDKRHAAFTDVVCITVSK